MPEIIDEEDDNWEPNLRTRMFLRWQNFKMRWLPYRTYTLIPDDEEVFKTGPVEWNWRLLGKGIGSQARKAADVRREGEE